MIHYLYYKLYRASLKSSFRDIPHVFTAALLGGLVSVNLIVVNGLLAKVASLPFLFSRPAQGGWLTAVLVGLVLFYYSKSRRELVFEKYSQENESDRKKGNAIVAIYVTLSFLLIFAIAFYKPGKL